MNVRVMRNEDGTRDVLVTPTRASGLPKLLSQNVKKEDLGATIAKMLADVAAATPD